MKTIKFWQEKDIKVAGMISRLKYRRQVIYFGKLINKKKNRKWLKLAFDGPPKHFATTRGKHILYL